MSSESAMADLRGIVLDAVGTLIEPRPGVSEVYALAARRQGVDLPTSELRERFRRSFATDEVDDLRGPLATDEANERRRWRRIVASCLPEVPDPDRAFGELWDHFADPASWVVFEDVAPAVANFREHGFRLCIGSNFDARLRGVMEGLPGLTGWAGSLVISSEVGYRKPHPAFYEAACRHLELRPEHVLFVGDDLENDARGPRRSGLRSHLIIREGAAPPGDGPTSPSLADLASLLERD